MKIAEKFWKTNLKRRKPMVEPINIQNRDHDKPTESAGEFDYTYVHTVARVAVYDDMRAAPRMIEIQPAPTSDYIEALASTVYEQAMHAGGQVPYTAIREVSENFIHAQFTEIVVSILDRGNTIRFTDQGPGIPSKEKAQLPGFSSAIEPMKKYIRGVGSGLPIVKEYLQFSHGTITIEDNLNTGAVVTLSLSQEPEPEQPKRPARTAARPNPLVSNLSEREKEFLILFNDEGALGVTDITGYTGYANSTTHNTLKRLEQSGLIEKTSGQKRILTDMGYRVVSDLLT